MHFAGTNTRTCESQQTLPIGFGSPKFTCLVLAKFNSRAVPPGTPASPQEVRSRGWLTPRQPVSQCQRQGWKWDIKALGLYSTQQTAPSKVSCQRWIVSSFICKTGLKGKREKSPKNKQKNHRTVLMNEKLSRLQKLSQLFWEQHITQITEEILWVLSISYDRKSD